MQNPYWIAYRNLRNTDKKRYMLSFSASYDILPWLSVSGRVRLDQLQFALYAETLRLVQHDHHRRRQERPLYRSPCLRYADLCRRDAEHQQDFRRRLVAHGQRRRFRSTTSRPTNFRTAVRFRRTAFPISSTYSTSTTRRSAPRRSAGTTRRSRSSHRSKWGGNRCST